MNIKLTKAQIELIQFCTMVVKHYGDYTGNKEYFDKQLKQLNIDIAEQLKPMHVSVKERLPSDWEVVGSISKVLRNLPKADEIRPVPIQRWNGKRMITINLNKLNK